jgi:Flp pilus assembly protein TadD
MESREKDPQTEGHNGDRSGHIAALLAEADRHIKEGNFDTALEVIRTAQAQDRENLFALAYVERIQALLNARKGRGSGAGGKKASQFAPAAASQQAPKQRADVSASQIAPGEGREAAFKNTIETIFARAREYHANGNFLRAIEELGRVRLFDPANPQVAALEAEIRKAIEVEKAREAEEQLNRQHEEEGRKRSLMEVEQERVRQEKDQARQREEEARRNAQQHKIHQYLTLAGEFLAAGKHAEASDQLAFVVVIDPSNAEATELQRHIREAQEKKRQEELDLRRKKEEEEQQRQAAVRAAIRKHIERSSGLAADGNYSEALRVITRAYVVDPLSEEVRSCEQRILEAQERAYRAAEEERRAAEQTAKQKREEELRRATEAERERLLAEQSAAVEREKKLNKETIAKHLGRAEECIASQKFHDALAEVAQAFAVDPFDEDVKRVEQMIVKVQEQQGAPVPAEPPDANHEAPEEIARREIGVRLAEAKRFRAEGDFARALDELTKAFVLDPLNAEVSTLEAEIEEELLSRKGTGDRAEPALEVSDEEFQKTIADLRQAAEEANREPRPAGKAVRHEERARELMAAGSYEDALTEVALGLTADPDNAELRSVETAIWEAQNAPAPDQENGRRVRIHLLAAEQLQMKGDFVRALDEVAKAYQIDPMNGEIKLRENLIRQDELRLDHPGETPLKLVYPRKNAASGSG